MTGQNFRLGWQAGLCLLYLILSNVAHSAKDNRVIDDVAYTQAMRLVDIDNGRRLNLYCTGVGQPVVVFDSGLGDSTKAWGLVQPEISKVTTTCSYDRAGLGFSDKAQQAGTSENAVSDLHALLHAAELPPPYVLVGHSYGGMNVKLFAEQHPLEVAGLVFVDASHENLGRDISALDPESKRKNLEYLEELKSCLSAEPSSFVEGSDLFKLCVGLSGARYSDAISAVEFDRARSPERTSAWISEMTHIWTTSADQVRKSYRRLGAIPIIVLTKEPAQPAENETVELRQEKNALWLRLHNEMASMSSRGERQTVMDTGHYIQHDQPGSIVDAIMKVLRMVNADSADTP